MPSPAEPRPTVAHVRRIWFKPTETFLHAVVTGCRRTRPLLLGHERAHADAFPVDAPVVALCPPGSLAARWNHWRARWVGGDPEAPLRGRRARQALERENACLIHAHFGYTGVHVLPLAYRSGLPLVTSFYGEDATALAADSSWRSRYERLFEGGARFLVEGPCLARRLADLGCPPEKILVQHIAIPLARYRFAPRTPRAQGEPVTIFFCASFREKKGLRYAFEAVARARAEHPRLVFRVGGDGPERAEVAQRIDALGLGDCTRLLGFLPHERMLEEMAAADLFIQPSVTAANGDTEGGAPTTLLEAQACGLPVLATRHADIPHVVVEGESALLAPERDAEALAENLRCLLKAPERWAAMGEAGRQHVERFHSVEGEAARLEDLYLELLGERP